MKQTTFLIVFSVMTIEI